MARNEVSTIMTASLMHQTHKGRQDGARQGSPRFPNQRREGLGDEGGPEGWRNLLKAIKLVRGRARDITLDFRLPVILSC